MGRRENAVVVETRLGLTYTAMARTTLCSASMLSRAASGRGVPSWQVVKEFTEACQADTDKAKQLWRNARWADQKLRRRQRQAIGAGFDDLAQAVGNLVHHQAIQLELIDDFVQLRRAMVELRAKYGQPSLSELRGQAAKLGHRLPKSSLSAILRGELLPRRRHIVAFTEALGLPGRRVAKWEAAWDRADRARAAKPSHAPFRRPAGPAPDMASTALPPVRIRISVPRPAPADACGPAGRDGTDAPGAAAAPLSLHLQDVDFLLTHGLTVDMDRGRASVWPGPRPPYPPAGSTGAGLPIRVPRRYDYFQRLSRA